MRYVDDTASRGCAGDGNQPLVTVVIDTYNSAHVLPRAVESVLAQTYPQTHIETLVIDDGSTDDTAEVVRAYERAVRYVRKQNGGQASAVNLGFREARGEIICLLDGDDYFYPDKLRLVVEAFRRPEVGLVYNKLDIVDDAGAIINANYPPGAWKGSLGARTLLGYPWSVPTSGISLRKSVIEGLQVPEDVFPTSPDVFLGGVLPLMAEVALLDRSLGAWVLHGDNQYLIKPNGPYPGFVERSREAVRRYGEHRLSQRFVTYLGRGGYGLGEAFEVQHEGRRATYARDFRQIAGADVDLKLKIRAQLKLAACLLIPRTCYSGLKRLTESGHGLFVQASSREMAARKKLR